jgi:hypothetical protein
MKRGEGATFSNSCFAVSYTTEYVLVIIRSLFRLSVHFSLGSMLDPHWHTYTPPSLSTSLQLTAERETTDWVSSRSNESSLDFV